MSEVEGRNIPRQKAGVRGWCLPGSLPPAWLPCVPRLRVRLAARCVSRGSLASLWPIKILLLSCDFILYNLDLIV